MNELFDVNGKIVVITGACGVLGSCASRYFASLGARVALLNRERSAEKGRVLAQEICAGGGDASFFVCDVLEEGSAQEALQQVLARYGQVDVLLNAAGGNLSAANVAPDQSVFDLDIEAMKKVCDLNIFGTVIPTKVFARAMARQKKGSIINFCSMSSFRPLSRVAGYGIAKAGIANWTQWLAGELAMKYGEGLRVNAVAPGFILTEQNRTLLTNPDGSPTERTRQILQHTPFGRLLQPDEILGALHYLASDASKGVTGTIVTIDGGFNSFSI